MHQIPAPAGDFVGRAAEIEQLVNALDPATQSSAAAICGMRGMGGIGKTQLAYAVAQQVLPLFPDAQILLDMRGSRPDPLPPEQALKTIIQALEPEASLPDDLPGLQTTYLSLCHDKHMLILADDAHDATQVAPLLPPRGSALLLTSRNRFSLPGMEIADLEVLKPLEAEQLLLEISSRIGSSASRLAQLCGFLPLALRLSANLIKDNPISVSSYREKLEDRRNRLKHLYDPEDPSISVEASLQLSYEAIDQNTQAVLCQLSVFPGTFDRDAALAVAALPGAEDDSDSNSQLVEVAIVLLYRRSLIEWDEKTERFVMHDLVRDFTSARLDDEAAPRLRHALYYAKVAALAEDFYRTGGESLIRGLNLFDRERTNIDTGWSWARGLAATSPGQEIGKLLMDYANATVGISEIRYDMRRERIPQLQAALAYARVAKDMSAEGRFLGSLGVAYRKLGDTSKAIGYYEQALEIMKEIGDHHSEGRALGNLGLVYLDLGDTSKGIGYYEQALEIMKEIGDRRDEGIAFSNLGLAYLDLGDTSKAIGYFEQHLLIVREIGDRHSEGTTLSGLGFVYLDLGDTSKAIGYFEQHLLIAREISDRRGEGYALGSLGFAYGNLGDTNKAISYYEQHLRIAREIGDRRGESISSGNLGLLMEQQGDLDRAIQLMRVLVDFEREIGHAAAEQDAAYLEQVERKLREQK
ncbi:MAG TPA: tetratricopeptide repeat protein [Chloroflexia bacterium]|nr:tetratricopeptide repeat protein [Chloroflexia bacterium]